jgi:hypothetical protein
VAIKLLNGDLLLEPEEAIKLLKEDTSQCSAAVRAENSICEEDSDFEGVIIGATDKQQEIVKKQLRRGLHEQQIERLANFIINHGSQYEFNSKYELVLRDDDGNPIIRIIRNSFRCVCLRKRLI